MSRQLGLDHLGGFQRDGATEVLEQTRPVSKEKQGNTQ
jgi:hypothetical protein